MSDSLGNSDDQGFGQATFGHTSVLLQEAIDGLDIQPGDIFLDGTLGSGGHSAEVAKRFGKSVKIIGLDADADAVARSKARLEKLRSDSGQNLDVTFVQSNFRDLDKALDNLKTENKIEKVNKILLDLGLSSNQIEQSGRGFSFDRNEPLQMTFAKNPAEVTAGSVVNLWSQETLETIIRGFGEERYAGRIARHIVEARRKKPITTTFELVQIIEAAVPARYRAGRIHPATRTFQALRIAANDELGALKEGLEKGFARLAPNGRMAVISFHSLEDRIVKNFFKERNKIEKAVLITKKPIIASEQERIANRRSRSAKLRILMKK